METHRTPEQEVFVREAIASGRLQSAEEAVEQAMGMWVQRERNRLEIIAALDDAEADIEAGKHTEFSEESLPHLMEELKSEARPIAACRLANI